jgi:Asp-tRNA(Asn)/Glu-tRNA(Gln) amidotransferase C subunit
MALENAEVLKNLKEQKVQLEENLETLRGTYQKVLGAIDVLEQIEESKVETVDEPTEDEEE